MITINLFLFVINRLALVPITIFEYYQTTLWSPISNLWKHMDIDFNKNEDINSAACLWSLNTRAKELYLGGGEKAAAKQKEKGKMLARERVAYLIDEDKPWLEVGAFTADGMYTELGGYPSGGCNMWYRLCGKAGAMCGGGQWRHREKRWKRIVSYNSKKEPARRRKLRWKIACPLFTWLIRPSVYLHLLQDDAGIFPR